MINKPTSNPIPRPIFVSDCSITLCAERPAASEADTVVTWVTVVTVDVGLGLSPKVGFAMVEVIIY